MTTQLGPTALDRLHTAMYLLYELLQLDDEALRTAFDAGFATEIPFSPERAAALTPQQWANAMFVRLEEDAKHLQRRLNITPGTPHVGQVTIAPLTLESTSSKESV